MEINDVNKRVRELVTEHREKEAYSVIWGELVDYYSTYEGKEELANSPHKNLRLTEAVALLMQGVAKRIEREVKNRDG